MIDLATTNSTSGLHNISMSEELSSTQPYIDVRLFVLVRHEVLGLGKILLPISSCDFVASRFGS